MGWGQNEDNIVWPREKMRIVRNINASRGRLTFLVFHINEDVWGFPNSSQ